MYVTGETLFILIGNGTNGIFETDEQQNGGVSLLDQLAKLNVPLIISFLSSTLLLIELNEL
jgi:hypothetical protein